MQLTQTLRFQLHEDGVEAEGVWAEQEADP